MSTKASNLRGDAAPVVAAVAVVDAVTSGLCANAVGVNSKLIATALAPAENRTEPLQLDMTTPEVSD